MGEPRPGDIPDPSHLKTTNPLIEGDQVANVGEYLIYNQISDFWIVPTPISAPRLISNLEAVQLEQDIDTTGLADGVANAAAFGNGSWIYALLAGDVLPNSPVVMVVFDTGAGFAIGFTNEITVEGDLTITSSVATVITDDPHGYKVGDKVTIVNVFLNETGEIVTITSIIDSTTFTVATTSSDFSTSTATSNFSALENGGSAKFIKRSGDTFAQKGVLNEIGIIAMTGVGL